MTERRGISKVMTRTSMRSVLAPLSWDATGAWHEIRLYVAESGTDGRLDKRHAHVAVNRKITAKRTEAAIAELVEHELITDAGDHWELVGWLDEQPSAEQWNDPIQYKRWRRREALLKDRTLRDLVQARDGNCCQYCGVRVKWSDKRGRHGGTYDHVDPDGDNSYGNVVVACRTCNGRKKDRTPEQWIAEDPKNGRPLLNDPMRPPPESTPDSTRSQLLIKSGGKSPSRAHARPGRANSELEGSQLPDDHHRGAA